MNIVKVLVTGASGFIGKNLRARLEEEAEVDEVLFFNRGDTSRKLQESLEEADFIFHLAAVMRPKEDSEFNKVNLNLTETITDHLKKNAIQTPLLLTSSVQAMMGNPYGESKRAAEEAVFRFAKSTGTKTYVYRLPNVFGKWARPNYSSVVATFCHNIANDLDIDIHNPAKKITLVYIDDVTADFVEAMHGDKKSSDDGFCYIEKDYSITLKELADKIYRFKNTHKDQPVPRFANNFDRFLYATYISYLDDDN